MLSRGAGRTEHIEECKWCRRLAAAEAVLAQLEPPAIYLGPRLSESQDEAQKGEQHV